jgi:membrane protein YqaA with SNARE-associated domain
MPPLLPARPPAKPAAPDPGLEALARPVLQRLYDWTMALAVHRHAMAWMAAVSFIESSVFPIPPDVMLVAMVLAAPTRAWRIATVCTLASVAGGWLGYAIGFFLFEAIGRPVLEFYNYMDKFAAFQHTFNTYGAWIVVIKGLTPIPYKLITITAGVTHLDLVTFTLASVVSRAIRFFLVAALLWKYGEPIRRFIEERLMTVTTTFAVLLVGGFVVVKYLV